MKPPLESEEEYPCTTCGDDAYIGLSNFRNCITGEQLIGKDERLCLKCAAARRVRFFGPKAASRLPQGGR